MNVNQENNFQSSIDPLSGSEKEYVFKIKDLNMAKAMLPFLVEQCALGEEEILERFKEDKQNVKKTPPNIKKVIYEKDIPFSDLMKLFHYTGFDLKSYLHVKDDDAVEDFINDYTDDINVKMILYQKIKHLFWHEISKNLGLGNGAYIKDMFKKASSSKNKGSYNIYCRSFEEFIRFFDHQNCYVTFSCLLPENLYFQLNNYFLSPEGMSDVQHYSTLGQKKYEIFHNKIMKANNLPTTLTSNYYQKA